MFFERAWYVRSMSVCVCVCVWEGGGGERKERGRVRISPGFSYLMCLVKEVEFITHTLTHTHTHAHTYTCTHACTHAHMHTHTSLMEARDILLNRFVQILSQLNRR